MREARIGLSVVAILLIIFLYVAFGRFSGWNRQRPVNHRQNADATNVSPATAHPQSDTGSAPANNGTVKTPSISPRLRQPNHLSQNPRKTGKSGTNSSAAGSFQLDQPSPESPQKSDAGRAVNTISKTFPPTNSDLPINGVLPTGQFVVPRRSKKDSSLRPHHQAARIRSTDDLPKNGPLNNSNKNSRADSARPAAPPRRELPSVRPRNLSGAKGASNTNSNIFKVTKQGESFWSIAQQAYGDGRFFNALYQYNRTKTLSFDDLNIGVELLIPSIQQMRRDWPKLCPPIDSDAPPALKMYQVKKGETLFDIARQQLGQASRYLEILELNKDSLPSNADHMTPLSGAIELRLPPK